MNAGDAALTLRHPAGTQASRVVRDRADFDRLVVQHQQMVLRVAYRLLGKVEDAQDASQEVFLRLLRNLAKVGDDPRGWLYRVTVNVCNDQFRKQARGPVTLSLAGNLDTALADVSDDAAEEVEQHQRKQILEEGLQHLTERERAAVVLRDIEGLTGRETAEAMGIEEVTVRTLASRARLKLAKYVQGRMKK